MTATGDVSDGSTQRLVALLTLGCLEPDPARAQNSTPEVIVKFKAGTVIDDAINNVQTNRQTSMTIINKHAAELSHQIGISFGVSRITFGKEPMLNLRMTELQDSLIEVFSNHPDAEKVDRFTQTDAARRHEYAVILTFVSGSPPHSALNAHSGNGMNIGSEVMTVINSVTSDLSYKIQPRVVEVDKIVLTIDKDGVAATLVELLGRRNDVEYAQQNFIFGF